MGYYINNTKSGPLGSHGKANDLVRDEGATIIPKPDALPLDKAVICVVNNGPFEAAAFAYNDRELEEFGDPNDHRLKTWLLMPLNRAKELSGYKR